MKKIVFILSACIFCIGQAVCGNVLTVSDVNVPQGGQATLEIGCEFEKEYTAFELQLALPTGLTLLTDADGYPVIEKAFDTNHILTGNLLPSNGNYKITCRSMDNLSIPGSGALFRVTVVADAGLVLGSSHTANITACEFTRTADSQGENLEDVSFTIRITEFRTILDETSTSAPPAATGVDVRVMRTIKANEWSTICLPFAMSETQVKTAFGDDVKLGDFTGYTPIYDNDVVKAITVNFSEVTAIEANHPYIIKVSSAITEFTADGVTINPAEAKVSFGTTTGTGKNKVYHPADFIGTYVADFDFYSEATSYPLFLNANKFYYATENTKHMKAFRAYFDFDDYMPEAEPSSAPIYISFKNETTGIRNINMAGETDSYYDLQGRRIETPSKGLYIKNGRKVVLK